MGHIFVSYSHKDKDYVHILQEALQNQGFEVWIDDRIDYGDEWPKVIQKHLDECDVFIVVVTENAFDSKWVQKEVARAERKKKPVFPLLLSGDAWLSVETTQYIDVRDGNLPPPKFFGQIANFVQKDKTVSINTAEVNVESKTSYKANNKSIPKKNNNLIIILLISLILISVITLVVFLINPLHPSPLVIDFYLSSDVGGKDKINTFSTEDHVYVFFYILSLDSGEMEAKYYALDNDKTNPANVSSYEYSEGLSRVIGWTPSQSSWASGLYMIEIYLDDNLAHIEYFEVR